MSPLVVMWLLWVWGTPIDSVAPVDGGYPAGTVLQMFVCKDMAPVIGGTLVGRDCLAYGQSLVDWDECWRNAGVAQLDMPEYNKWACAPVRKVDLERLTIPK